MQRPQPCEDRARPVVILGPPPVQRTTKVGGCPPPDDAAAVWLAPARIPAGSTATATLNGIKIEVVTRTVLRREDRDLRGSGTNVEVLVLQRHRVVTVKVANSAAFPGGAPGRAHEIAQSIHPVGR